MGNHVEQLDLGIDLAPDRGPRPGTASAVDNRRLTTWIAGGQRARLRPDGRDRAEGGVRFAFYGRVSTAEYQDADSSRGWQRDSAHEVIAGRGRIVVEYFDVGYSRTVPWTKRPEAARLMEAVNDPDCGFDAIIVGEAERAFTGPQLLRLAPVLLAQGVQVWLPEFDGPVDLVDPSHRALIMQLGSGPAGRSPVLGTAPPQPCRPRPETRAATWADVLRTGTGWWTPGPTRTPPMQFEGGVCNA